MDPRRDYPKFTDAALEFFLRRFPSHPDHAAALAEVERRRQNRRDSAKPADEKATRVDSGVLIWAVGGILILALVLLFFLLPLAMARLTVNAVQLGPPSDRWRSTRRASVRPSLKAHLHRKRRDRRSAASIRRLR